MYKSNKRRPWQSTSLSVLVLVMAVLLSGCGRLRAPLAWLRGGETDATGAPVSPLDDSTAGLTLMVDPPGGSGGLYISVQGEKWPRNMLALVTLEDDAGRSETLAAADTDQAGSLTTGFVFPIDERWIESDSTWVVVTTADGDVEAKTRFTVVPPGTDVPANASRETVIGTPNGQVTAGANVTATENLSHALTLPLVLHSDVQAEDASGDAREVAIAFVPAQASPTFRCDDPGAWITLAILSASDFDATGVVPGSVAVANGTVPAVTNVSAPASAQGDLILASYSPGQATDQVASSLANFTWRWSLDDVDQDGRTDLVMEFRLDSTSVTCDAAAVRVTGRTKDGLRFVGTVAMTTSEEQREQTTSPSPDDNDDDEKNDKKDKKEKPGRGRGRSD